MQRRCAKTGTGPVRAILMASPFAAECLLMPFWRIGAGAAFAVTDLFHSFRQHVLRKRPPPLDISLAPRSLAAQALVSGSCRGPPAGRRSISPAHHLLQPR